MLALIGIVLFALSLRSAVASLSPLVDHITEDFAMPAVVIGLIGTAPPVCYAVFGILTPSWERRLGLERLTVIAIAIVTAGTVVRALAPDAVTLLLGTTLIFAAVGVGNILLPPLVRTYFPDRIGLMTTVYSTTMAIATLSPPLVAVPVADSTDWRFSLGLWAVFAAVALIPWIALLVRGRSAPDEDDLETPNPRVFGRMWRLPLAWGSAGTAAGEAAHTLSCFAIYRVTFGGMSHDPLPGDPSLPSRAEQAAVWGGEHLSDDLERTVRAEIADAEREDRPLRRMLRRVRAWVSRHPRLEHAYRLAVGVFGGMLTLIGLVMVPLPGPGWLVVFLGLAVLGTEFHWARRIAAWLKRQLDRFWTWWKARRARRAAERAREDASRAPAGEARGGAQQSPA